MRRFRTRWFGATLAGVGSAALARRLRALSPSGTAAASVLATTFLALGGRRWTVPGTAFFGLSSALSKWPRSCGPAQTDGKGSERDATQVAANGVVAWLCLLVQARARTDTATDHALYAAGCGALAAAAADTWATEIGTRSGAMPRSIRTGARVAPGTSGGISWPGTLGGALGAASVALPAAATLPSEALPRRLAAALVGSGVAGMLADSWVGATLQARYEAPGSAGRTEQRPHPGAQPVRGHAWITNDTVNLIGTAAGALAAGGIAWILHQRQA